MPVVIRSWISVVAFASMLVLIPAAPLAAADAPATEQETSAMTRHARGPFTVKMAPQGEGDSRDGVSTGRLSLDKLFSGDLDATGTGEMLTARTAIDDSAGYVAIERVTGTLHGRKGSFVFQHSGTMARGAQDLRIGIVPDSGTGELAGIAGTMTIAIAEGGAHSYDLAYTLPVGD
jgi:hypothetical protein